MPTNMQANKTLSPYVKFITKTGLTFHPGGLTQTKSMLDKIRVKKSFRILDIGCGTGHTSSYIAKTYQCRVFGVDISHSAIEHAKALHKNKHSFKKLKFKKGNICSLPFEDNFFDMVICESVLLFVENKELALSQINRVLKKNGVLLINEIIHNERDCAKLKQFFHNQFFGAHLISEHELIYKIVKCGFEFIVADIKNFNINNQILLQAKQLLNLTGIFQGLEIAFLLFTNLKIRNAGLKTVRHLIDWPKESKDSLRNVLLLLKKS